MSFHNSLNIFLHLVLLTLFLLPSAYPLYFNISSFDPEDSQIIYGGDAQPSQGSDNNYFIEFNTVKFSNQVGRSTYSKPMHLWDSSTGELSDFTTNFSLVIDTLNASIYGHGFAFFLAPLDFPIPINSAGGFLGLFNQTTSDAIDKNQIIFVEFDTYSNPQWDPPMEHVGINKNSITSSVYTGWNASMHSGESINTCITYNSANNNLTVVWHFGETPSFQNNYSLSYQVDMKQVLPDWVTIGFTAATGTYRERHILHSWEFSSSLETNADNKNQLGKIKLIAIVVVPTVFLIVLVVIIYAVFRRKRLAKEKADQTSINFEIGVPRRFSYKELASATSNFSIERKLGEGGFGGVYRGTLANSSLDVAIKKISKESKQGKKEYMAEVKIISQLRHRNLVQLLGWCHERGEFLLVYDFMPQGSLDFHLFGNNSPLSWSVRYNIALGLASALLYLHEEREQCVVHRDIKSSNVMLDSDFNAKLGDFGLARLMEHNLSLPTTQFAGTIGYIAPECFSTGKTSKETDVYSYGVVALEIACGRKSTDIIEDGSPLRLVGWVWTLYGMGKLQEAVDETLCMEIDLKHIECLITVGLWCAHPNHHLRPTIRQALQVLNFEAALPDLPKKLPVPRFPEPVP